MTNDIPLLYIASEWKKNPSLELPLVLSSLENRRDLSSEPFTSELNGILEILVYNLTFH